MERLVRSVIACAGAVAALIWAVLFVRSPRVALELLVLTSPIVVTVWMIMVVSAPARRKRSGRGVIADAALQPDGGAVRRAVLARDRGRCTLCGRDGAVVVAARRPARVDEFDRLARFVSLCAGCAATGALPALPVSAPFG